MDTQSRTNAEFRSEVSDTLDRHEASIGQVNATLQTVLSELQAIRIATHSPHQVPEENPFSHGEMSTHFGNDSSQHLPKLLFPRFDGEDP